MSKADELLDTLSEGSDEIVTGNNIIIGTDRYIVVPESLKKIAVQYDHNVETVTFDCPRYWDGHDLSVMNIYINYMRPDGMLGMHLCDNVVADSENPEIMHFDWTISGHTTYAAGNLSFLVCIKKTAYDGTEITHWNSEICTDCYISAGMKCQETILRRYPDIIAQLLLRMENSEAIVTDAAEAKNDAVAAKEAIENMTVSSEALTSGEPVDIEKSTANGVTNLHFKLPAGPKGDAGNSIVSFERTSGNGAPGTVDTYTVGMSNGTSFSFDVRNGADGMGAEGAMQTAIYDPNNRGTDIFKYVDDVAQEAGETMTDLLHTHATNYSHVSSAERDAWNAKLSEPKSITKAGAISFTLENNAVYTLTNVSSLSLAVPDVQCHIFVSTATDLTVAFTAVDDLVLHFNEGGFPILKANSRYEISVWKGNILCVKVV